MALNVWFGRIAQLVRSYDNPRLYIKNIVYRLPSTVSDLDIIFVVGAPRSGTTLLQSLLAAHSKLFSIEAETAMFSYQNIFDPKRRHFGLSPHQLEGLFGQSKDIVDFFSKAVNLLSAKYNHKRFVEKTPQHVFYLRFIFKHFPKSKVIHIVRDGRDCYCSSKFHPNIPQGKSVTSFAKYWKKCVKSAKLLQNNANILTIKYEELVNSPQISLQEIMDFLGLKYEKDQLDQLVYGADVRSRLEPFSKLAKPIDASSVGRYLLEMSDNECCNFERIARKELSHFGYP